MSATTDHTRHEREHLQQTAGPRDGRIAVDSPERAEPAERTGVPEAVQAARVARGHRARDAGAQAMPARGVEWVRPTDLLARQSATVAGRGIDFEVELARRTRRLTGQVTRASGRGVGKVGKAISARARRLPDVSEFGRGSRHSWMSRSGIGLG